MMKQNLSLQLLGILNCQWFHFMGVGVTSEINFAVECSIANAARERFETRMFATVSDEIRRLTKRFPALQALVRLLSRVNIRVFLHVGFLMEPLSTVVARERSSVWMNEHMCGEGGRALERLAEQFTLECSFVGVNVLVLLEADCVSKRLTAHVTSKRAPTGVWTPHVHFQTVWRTEDLFAV